MHLGHALGSARPGPIGLGGLAEQSYGCGWKRRHIQKILKVN
jgi:hypothetical protein